MRSPLTSSSVRSWAVKSGRATSPRTLMISGASTGVAVCDITPSCVGGWVYCSNLLRLKNWKLCKAKYKKYQGTSMVCMIPYFIRKGNTAGGRLFEIYVDEAIGG